LFLHQVVAKMPAEKQLTIKRLHSQEAVLANKQVLLVDDDTRNAFALSKLLSDKGLKVTIAQSGAQALRFLEQRSYDLVLMDIMMPEMDGYEAIEHIRQQPALQSLPILALTAKAMKGDREKCIQAGANDYLPKPVDPERLFSMLRVWLYR
jgi:CheY-like chemotaxis protein